MLNIAFTGGGTGGHIYPGLAVASRLIEFSSCRIFWIGSSSGMDRSIVEGAGIPFFGIPAGKLRRNFSLKNFIDIFRVLAAFFAARRILKREKPALLFSKGGFVSVPPCAAAASLGITVFTHESDFSPGLATRLNARFAARGRGRIFTAYAETAAAFPQKYRPWISVSGNPVRKAFRNADACAGRAFAGAGPDDKILLVLGGSQGAQEINSLVTAALPELCSHYVVVHQTGPHNDGGRPTERYKPFPYIKDEMPAVLAAALLVLGRSGAGTVWECAAAGKPMILVPLAGSGTRGDQVENARYFEKAGAALILPPAGSFDEAERARRLVSLAAELAADSGRLGEMACAAAKLGAGDGALILAQAVIAAGEGGNGAGT